MVRYRAELVRLRDKQVDAAVSSKRLDRGVRDVERRYREAKREVKSYGISVDGAARSIPASAGEPRCPAAARAGRGNPGESPRSNSS